MSTPRFTSHFTVFVLDVVVVVVVLPLFQLQQCSSHIAFDGMDRVACEYVCVLFGCVCLQFSDLSLFQWQSWRARGNVKNEQRMHTHTNGSEWKRAMSMPFALAHLQRHLRWNSNLHLEIAVSFASSALNVSNSSILHEQPKFRSIKTRKNAFLHEKLHSKSNFSLFHRIEFSIFHSNICDCAINFSNWSKPILAIHFIFDNLFNGICIFCICRWLVGALQMTAMGNG